MKRSVTLLLLALLAATSCGTSSQFAAEQDFYDGIYYRPSVTRKVHLLSEEDFANLASQNIQLEKKKEKDTTVILVVPENKVNFYFGIDFLWGFGPRFGWYGRWGWYDPWWYYDYWYVDPWNPLWRPWPFGPWDPWYGPWRPWDPWYGPGPYPVPVYPVTPHGPYTRPLAVGGVGAPRTGGMGTISRGRSMGSGAGYDAYNRTGSRNINPLSGISTSGRTGSSVSGSSRSFRVTPDHGSTIIQRGGGSSRNSYGNGPTRSPSSSSSSRGSYSRGSSSPAPSSSGGGGYSGGGGGYSGGGAPSGGSRGGGMGGGRR